MVRRVERNSNVLSIGYFGSYARGDNGVGSDLDGIVIVKDSKAPFGKRGTEWDLSILPVPFDLLIYTLPSGIIKQRTVSLH